MKAYVLKSNNLGVESAWRSIDDLMSAMRNHVENHNEEGLSLDVTIENRPEKTVDSWPVQFCICGENRKRKLYTNTCVVCGKDVLSSKVMP